MFHGHRLYSDRDRQQAAAVACRSQEGRRSAQITLAGPASDAPRSGANRPSRLVQTVMALLSIEGTPSRFFYESTAIHGLRRAWCLRGEPWHLADERARDVVLAAQARLGISRPTWAQGQPEIVELGIDRECRNCRAPVGAGRVAFCSTTCRQAWHNRRQRIEGARRSQAQMLAERAALAAQRAQERVTCEACGGRFVPDRKHRRSRVYCSQACAGRAQRKEGVCAQCGATFFGRRSKYCSAACYHESRSATKACLHCRDLFKSKNGAKYCSRKCYGAAQAWAAARERQA